MGEVVILDAWRNGDKVVITNSCPRPFHHEEYVFDNHCLGCDTSVVLAEADGSPGSRREWYG